jgi:coproporphyrinogen III oxidase
MRGSAGAAVAAADGGVPRDPPPRRRGDGEEEKSMMNESIQYLQQKLEQRIADLDHEAREAHDAAWEQARAAAGQLAIALERAQIAERQAAVFRQVIGELRIELVEVSVWIRQVPELQRRLAALEAKASGR